MASFASKWSLAQSVRMSERQTDILHEPKEHLITFLKF